MKRLERLPAYLGTGRRFRKILCFTVLARYEGLAFRFGKHWYVLWYKQVASWRVQPRPPTLVIDDYE